ncbi:lipocalin-like domain-containing protein [Halomonas sp. M4R1S46]|uniref:lipocalin-like domain-containing protein n=1 Tax=Halomonas sp. M4R1S46 TaxID=2982692 RepID=UPI0021E4442D|nr:lipocalin-like domain-containing protein [Halomonas sp. M4R1S46]UYG07611.1 iron ABC transporter permease [Halomonas sp. M4R1S46]
MRGRRRLVTGLLAIGLVVTGLLIGCERDSAGEPRAGFAGLGADAGGFTPVAPEASLRFPEDHGPHPGTRLEWWYLTANLRDAEGTPLGIQWTLFRRALRPPSAPAAGAWAADQLWMAHVAVSRGADHRVAERFARGAGQGGDAEARQAGVTAAPFRAWLDDWRLESRVAAGAGDALDRLVVSAEAGQGEAAFGYRLSLDAEGPLVRHGKPAFGEGSAEATGPIYLSQPFYRVTGTVTLGDERLTVSGRAWLDREWGNRLMAPWHRGWDWFSLHLASGHKLMVYQLRGEAASDTTLFGTWIAADGETRALDGEALTLVPLATRSVAGRELPLRWRLTLPAQGLDLEVSARHPNRWMATSVPYWEGAVTVRDRDGGAARGEGYLEMTGY